ncbi:hypothetical protein AB0G98_16665 [Streptomyces sp. NPDC020196]|uniref:hypothetical protein n=1 Tax=Streptomyces sp. NPDC020196 TaxID=3156656 RepID=UPI0033CBF969
MDEDLTNDVGVTSRQARFSKLPERIPLEDMITEENATPNDTSASEYDPENSLRFYACLALD